MTQILRPVSAWFGLLVLAFVNGAFREFVMKPVFHLNTTSAQQLSCLTGVALWFGFLFLVWKRLRIRTAIEAAWVGAGWFVATFLFETFVLNRNMSRAEILQTYNVADGEFWGLALLTIGLLPIFFFQWKRERNVRLPG